MRSRKYSSFVTCAKKTNNNKNQIHAQMLLMQTLGTCTRARRLPATGNGGLWAGGFSLYTFLYCSNVVSLNKIFKKCNQYNILKGNSKRAMLKLLLEAPDFR